MRHKFNINAEAARILAEYPAEKRGETWHLQTEAGELAITPHDDWIAMKFAEPKRVRNIYGEFNEHSGKWNIVDRDASATLKELRVRLEFVSLCNITFAIGAP